MDVAHVLKQAVDHGLLQAICQNVLGQSTEPKIVSDDCCTSVC